MNLTKTKVILVDDNDLYRTALKRLFDQATDAYQIVAEAKCGQEALDEIKSIPADLIMLDLNLPHISGLKLIGEAKKVSPAKILVLTIHSNRDTIQKAFGVGADGFCLKEAHRSIILKAVEETLTGTRGLYLA